MQYIEGMQQTMSQAHAADSNTKHKTYLKLF